MKADVEAVRRMLGPYDPAAAVSEAELDMHADVTLERLLATHRAPATRRLPGRRRVAFALAALLALGAAIVALTGVGERGRAYAVTPSPLQLPTGHGRPARQHLLRLARRAAAQPPPAAGRYHYLKLRAWYLDTAASGGSATSDLQPEVLEQWLTDDGSGRVVTLRGDDRDVVAAKPIIHVRLSHDPAVLSRQLVGHPPAQGANPDIPNGVERLERAMDVLRAGRGVDPRLQAAIWRVLARQGLRARGAITDRAGRRGVAFTLDSDYTGLPTRYLLVVDPHAGKVLDYEEVLTRSAGKLNVRIPAVLSYEVFVAAGNVPRIGARP